MIGLRSIPSVRFLFGVLGLRKAVSTVTPSELSALLWRIFESVDSLAVIGRRAATVSRGKML